jgi:N-terminal half of MaoC dehydratase
MIAEEIRLEYELRYGAPRYELIEAGRVRDYLLAMDEIADILPDVPVPALFLVTLARTRRPQPSKGSAVNAGDEYQFLRPVFIGDTIEVSRKVLAVEEKHGKAGLMYLTKAEVTYRNQREEIVAIAKSNTLRWGW